MLMMRWTRLSVEPPVQENTELQLSQCGLASWRQGRNGTVDHRVTLILSTVPLHIDCPSLRLVASYIYVCTIARDLRHSSRTALLELSHTGAVNECGHPEVLLAIRSHVYNIPSTRTQLSSQRVPWSRWLRSSFMRSCAG